MSGSAATGWMIRASYCLVCTNGVVIIAKWLGAPVWALAALAVATFAYIWRDLRAYWTIEEIPLPTPIGRDGL